MNHGIPTFKANSMRIRHGVSHRGVFVGRLRFESMGARAVRFASGEDFDQHNFASGSLKAWEMPFPEDWEILQQGDLHYLHMKRNREPLVPRRPDAVCSAQGRQGRQLYS